jgi:hypothetical protein
MEECIPYAPPISSSLARVATLSDKGYILWISPLSNFLQPVPAYAPSGTNILIRNLLWNILSVYSLQQVSSEVLWLICSAIYNQNKPCNTEFGHSTPVSCPKNPATWATLLKKQQRLALHPINISRKQPSSVSGRHGSVSFTPQGIAEGSF